jgi:hypothetical protein
MNIFELNIYILIRLLSGLGLNICDIDLFIWLRMGFSIGSSVIIRIQWKAEGLFTSQEGLYPHEVTSEEQNWTISGNS